MKKTWNHFGKRIGMLAVLCTAVMAPKMITFAGEINGNEARVISAASGTFSYEGKTYRAGSAYINSLTSYLSADDVDLTAAQADEAISTMYASIGEGVAQGYLYEVGGEDSEEEASTQEKEEKKDKKSEDNEEKDKDETETNSDGQSSGDVEVWDTMADPTENKMKLKERPDKEKAEVSVEMNKDSIVVQADGKKPIQISRDEQIIPASFFKIAFVTAAILFAVTIVCGIILFATKCMTFKKRKDRRARPGHSKRRKIRHNVRNVLTVTTGISLIVVFVLLGLYVNLFDKDAIMQNMQSSGYFRYAYSEYISDLVKDFDFEKLAEEKTMQADIQTYEDYLFTIKKNSLDVLDGNMNSVIPDSNVAPYIYNLKQEYMKLFRESGIFMIANVLLGIILMIFMDLQRERGIKHTAVAELAASGVLAVVMLVMVLQKPYLQLYIEPDYLYLFLMECIKRCVAVMTSITAFSVVLGMVLVGVYKTLVNNKNS